MQSEQEHLRKELEDEMRSKIDDKEREVRQLRTQLQQKDHGHALEME